MPGNMLLVVVDHGGVFLPSRGLCARFVLRVAGHVGCWRVLVRCVFMVCPVCYSTCWSVLRFLCLSYKAFGRTDGLFTFASKLGGSPLGSDLDSDASADYAPPPRARSSRSGRQTSSKATSLSGSASTPRRSRASAGSSLSFALPAHLWWYVPPCVPPFVVPVYSCRTLCAVLLFPPLCGAGRYQVILENPFLQSHVVKSYQQLLGDRIRGRQTVRCSCFPASLLLSLNEQGWLDSGYVALCSPASRATPL